MHLFDKKIISSRSVFLIVFSFFAIHNLKSQLSFSLTSASGIYSITCGYSEVTVTASSNYTASPVSFVFTNPYGYQSSGPVYSSSLTGIFTVVATAGTLSATQTYTVTNYLGNPPVVSVYASSQAFTCLSPTVKLTAFTPTLGANYCTFVWTGVQTVQGATNTIYVPGTYTVEATDTLTGCKGIASILIGDNRIYPPISSPGHYTVSCPTGTVNISPAFSSTVSNLLYNWATPPGAVVSGANTATLNTNMQGTYTVVATNSVNGCSSRSIFNVWACVGLEEFSNNALSIKAYPNPFNHNLQLQLSDLSPLPFHIRLFNQLGQEVFTKSNASANEELNLSFLPSGVYYLKIQQDHFYSCEKVIKWQE